MSLTAGMGNGEWENKMLNRKKGKLIFFFNFLYLLIFFIDINVLYQQRSKFKKRNKLMKRKEVTFEEQVMFKEKYTSTFSRRIGAVMFLILQIFCNA